ncbi:MAG: hypothetical protein J5X21_21455, partial [Candidatus Accumulibacter sp.]|nr:hypothetical protein [Candidatus Accumulibacter conexus]
MSERATPQIGRAVDLLTTSEQPNPARGPGVPEETTMRYKVNGDAEMTDTSLVRVRGVSRR